MDNVWESVHSEEGSTSTSKDGNIIIYKEKDSTVCPFDGDIIYDTTTNTLTYHSKSAHEG